MHSLIVLWSAHTDVLVVILELDHSGTRLIFQTPRPTKIHIIATGVIQLVNVGLYNYTFQPGCLGCCAQLPHNPYGSRMVYIGDGGMD